MLTRVAFRSLTAVTALAAACSSPDRNWNGGAHAGGGNAGASGTVNAGAGRGSGGDAAARGGSSTSPGAGRGNASSSDDGGSDPGAGAGDTAGDGPTAGGSTSSGGSGQPGGGTSNGSAGDSTLGGSGGTGTGGTLGMAGSGAGGSATAGAGNAGGTEPIGGCEHQLLANADFEQGPGVAWSEESNWVGNEIITEANDPKLVAETVTPYAGSYVGWLGGIPDNEFDHYVTILRQEVTIPSDASQLTLSGQHLIRSLDDPAGMYDVAYLEFDDADTNVVWQAQAWSNIDTTSGWVAFQRSTTDLDALRGQTLTFVAYANTDPMNETSFFIDDLRLVATCGH